MEKWKERGPIHTFSARLKVQGLLDEDGFLAIAEEVNQEVEAAVAFAEAGSLEPVLELERDVYSQEPAA
ncbi:pyruvate dehydrogenase (acetyl-transferring) E1 component, alpha subunit [compost metagenome]